MGRYVAAEGRSCAPGRDWTPQCWRLLTSCSGAPRRMKADSWCCRTGGGRIATTSPRQWRDRPPGTGPGYITEQGYTHSVIRALDGSCEDPASFVVASIVHTHLVQTGGLTKRNDNFTMIDFKSAFDWRRLGGFNFGPYKISNAFEGIYMINARNRCVQSFTAENQDDKKYDEDRLDPDELQRRARPVGATCL